MSIGVAGVGGGSRVLGLGPESHTAPQWVDVPASDAEGAVKASAASRGCFVRGSSCHVCSDGTVMDLGHK